MKKIVSNFSLVILLILMTFQGYSQTIIEGQKANLIYKGAELIRTSKHSELPSYIRFSKTERIANSQLKVWIKENLDINSDMGFEIMKVETDQIGFTHTRLKQTYKNIPIEAAVWLTHVKKERVHSMNGLIFKDLNIPFTPSITEVQALDNALLFVGAESYKWEIPEEEEHLKWEGKDPTATYFPKGELVFVAKDHAIDVNNYRLAYKFNIYAQKPLYRAHVFVDAITGEVISENGLIHHVDTPGTAITAYSGSRGIMADSFMGQFRLRDGSRGLGVRTFDLNNSWGGYGGAVDFLDADNIWDNVNPQLDQYAGDAHWGTEMSYDYFNIIHGRNSLDGAGFQLNTYVHYGVNYVNAFWDGTRMTYGDGNGSPYTPLTSIDIAGHELTHGLTNFTANLIYFAESGALNESFSDIFGTAIENYSRPGDWDWLLSDDIGGVFRSLENPNAYGHPDTYFGTNWASLGGGDNGGVHTNSGVQNFWYYLLVSGGLGTNDIGDAYDVSAIGFTSASAIAFRNLTVYLTDASDHADARFFAIQSAIDLFGACSVEEEETTNAWYAVGVGPEYVSQVIADFSATIGCFPIGTVDFTDISTTVSGVVDTWEWDFSDGGTSTVETPSHDFSSTGVFPVELRVTTDLGCENLISIDINVFDAPIVDFTTANLCETNLTAFTNASSIASGTISSWAWDFDDAATAAILDPSHVFSASGTFDVKLIATSDNGCIDSVTIPVTISSTPTADFSFVNDCFNIDADFTNLSSTTDGSVLTDFTWGFGDGSAVDLTESPSHTYTSPGTYDVTLDIVSPDGCTNTVTYSVTRFAIPEANFSTDNVCIGEDAFFTDLSTIIAPDVIASLDWTFGDGDTGTGGAPTHLYGTSGTFDVTLTATTVNGCEDETTLPITIYPSPVANFSATSICINEGATAFTDLSTVTGGTIDSWLWDFGDGSGATISDPTNNYSTDGVFNAELTIRSNFDCENTVTIPVTVYEKPNASFTVSSTAICSPSCIDFINSSTSATTTLTNWQWNFENGDVSFDENPNVCFTATIMDELYDVELIVTNDVGCKDTIVYTDLINVTATPIASFTCESEDIDIFDPEVFFINTSDYGNNYVWTFGDHTANSTNVDPSHTYIDKPGTYTVTLEAISASGLCSSFAKKVVTIKDIIIYYIPNSFTPDGDTFNETFTPVFRSGYDPYDYHFMIFNRWGEMVFESYNAAYGWDGTYGSLGLVESDVYVWSLDFSESTTDKRHKKSGHVTLIK